MAKTTVDLILYNGILWTGDPDLPQAEALAVAAGKILAVGSNAEIEAAYDALQRVDLEGGRLLPGLHDSHMHLMNTGHYLALVSLVGCASVEEMIVRLKTAPQDENWIVARGFLQDLFAEKRMPTCHDLDRVSTTRPVLAVRACGHVAICNSLLLQMAGVKPGFGQVDGGEIGYDAEGNPNGMLAENALGLVYSLTPERNEAEMRRDIARASAAMARAGLTTVCSDDFGNSNWDEQYAAFSGALKAGELKVRLQEEMRFDKPEDVASFVAWQKKISEQAPLDPARISFGPVKVMCDGSLGGRTAAMSEPYADDPNTTGVAVMSRQEIAAIFKPAHQAGYQLSGHAIGDAAICNLMEAMAEAIPPADRATAMPRVIHAQITTAAMLQRMQELKIHCDIQPAFVPTDLPILESRIGAAKASTSYAWATMRKMGISTSGGSDSPVEDFNPLYGIFCAVMRQSTAGEPVAGWNPTERLTIEEALQLYTVDAARVAGLAGIVGQLKAGQYADFVWLDRDILSVDPAEIWQTKVRTTWLGGVTTYTA